MNLFSPLHLRAMQVLKQVQEVAQYWQKYKTVPVRALVVGAPNVVCKVACDRLETIEYSGRVLLTCLVRYTQPK